MDTLAALAFGGEPALKRFMKEKPKKRSESIVSKKMWSSIITGSLWMFILGFLMLTFSPLQSIFVEGLEGVCTCFHTAFLVGTRGRTRQGASLFP